MNDGAAIVLWVGAVCVACIPLVATSTPALLAVSLTGGAALVTGLAMGSAASRV